MSSLLIVEDDELLRDSLSAALAQAGHTVITVADAASAQAQLTSTHFDGVILDLKLRKVSGMAVLSWLRNRLPALPVLVLTASEGMEDGVRGLNAGADDYLSKPINMVELQARVAALLRRSRLPAFGGALEVTHHSANRLRVHATSPQAWVGNEPMELNQREWALLSLLVTQAGRVVSREEVLANWQSEPTDSAGGLGTNALEVYIHRLRRKLTDSGLSIRKVRGLGYMMDTAVSCQPD